MTEKNNIYKTEIPPTKLEFFNPNELNELLDNLQTFELYTNNDSYYVNDDGQFKIEKHKPYEDAEKAKITKKATVDPKYDDIKMHTDIYNADNFRDGLLLTDEEIEDLLEWDEEFFKHMHMLRPGD